MSLTYIASPYTHLDPAVREQRFQSVCRYCAGLIRDGENVYSPIAHLHPIATVGDLPTDWNYWAELDQTLLAYCDRMIVLELDGWDTSRGVKAEIAYAEWKGIPVEYHEWKGDA